MPAHDICLISGLVTDQSNEPIAMARIFFTAGPVPLPDVAALSGNDGRFRLSVTAPGLYTLRCVADGFSPTSTMVTASPNQEAKVIFRLVAINSA